MAAPLGVLYAPMRAVEGLQRLQQEPVRCSMCSAVLNPFASVDMASGLWMCPICKSWSALPPSLARATEAPPEMRPDHTTIEYEVAPAASGGPAALLLVLDCSLP
eukprot:1484961-Prymnesium_polylepis.1